MFKVIHELLFYLLGKAVGDKSHKIYYFLFGIYHRDYVSELAGKNRGLLKLGIEELSAWNRK